MEIETKSKEELFTALWGNFEHFGIISYPKEESQTFITTNRSKIFSKENFLKAYKEGHMDINDLIYVLFWKYKLRVNF